MKMKAKSNLHSIQFASSSTHASCVHTTHSAHNSNTHAADSLLCCVFVRQKVWRKSFVRSAIVDC